jgi:hypothetical protein
VCKARAMAHTNIWVTDNRLADDDTTQIGGDHGRMSSDKNWRLLEENRVCR